MCVSSAHGDHSLNQSCQPHQTQDLTPQRGAPPICSSTMRAFVGGKPQQTWRYHFLGGVVAYYPAGSQLREHGKQLDLISILQLGFTHILL